MFFTLLRVALLKSEVSHYLQYISLSKHYN